MNVARARNHRALRDALLVKKRTPGLIDLPFSLPSIPVLNPLVTALIGDSNPRSDTKTASSTTPAPPVSTSEPPGGSGGGSGGGGSSGGGSSGGSSGGSGSSGNSGGNSGTSGGNTSGSGANNTGGGGNSNTASSEGTTPTSSSGSTSSTASGNSQNSSSGGTNNTPSGNSSSKGANFAASETTSSADSSSSVIVNVAPVPAGATATADPVISTQLSTEFSNGVPVATHTNLITSTPQPTANGSSTPGSSSTTANGSASKHGLPSAAIAAIVLVSLLLTLVLTVFILRRRSKEQRAQRVQRWWQANVPTLSSDPDPDRWSGGGTGDATVGSSGLVSARSSFATTYDHSRTSATLDFTPPPPPLPVPIPISIPIPPMVEIRDTHAPGFLLHTLSESSPVHPITITPVLTDSTQVINRVSSYSNRSSASSSSFSHHINLDGYYSPMSVRPFSPTELFTFPKPPSSNSTPPPPKSALLLDTDTDNPFADPETKIQLIRRSFAPTLHDEISVSIGDRVRISRVFDDGWVLVEKDPLVSPGKGKAKALSGLIPVDCLREGNHEDLPAFLASKRESSYPIPRG